MPEILSLSVCTISKLSMAENPSTPNKISGEISVSPIVMEKSAKEKFGRRLTFLWSYLSPLLGLLWLAPIITLLTLNFEGYIAGASVGCGVENCDVLWSTNTSQKLDARDHNILGALQLVSKALEVWFIFLAGALVYNLSMLLATKKEGLPLRYLFTHKEFGELASIFKGSYWSAAFWPGVGEQKRKWKLCSFVLLVAALTIVSNLMGPSTAVLLLPTLGWQEFDIPQTRAFVAIASASPPTTSAIDTTIDSDICDAETLSSGTYSCTALLMAPLVDGMMSSVELIDSGQSLFGAFQASSGIAVFSFNITQKPNLVLAPNRQVVARVGLDLFDWILADAYDYTVATETSNLADPPILTELSQPEYKVLRNSLLIQRQRQGPALSSDVQCYNVSSITRISADKSVHCYDFPNPDPGQSFGVDVLYPYPISNSNILSVSTMCIRVGSGWGNATIQSDFYIETSSASTDPIAVNIYSSDRAIYLNSTTYDCQSIENGTATDLCNWDAMFLMDPVPDYVSTSINPQVVEYTYPDSPTMWCRSFAYLKFPTYILSSTSFSVSFDLSVVVEDNTVTSSSDEAVSVHPDWILAALSVDQNGTLTYDRQAAQVIGDILFLNVVENTVSVREFVYAHQVALLNGLSLIDYSTQDAKSSTPTNPIFKVSILRYVWSYGLGSRTSKMGAVIAVSGCIFVLLHIFVALRSRAVKLSLLDFLIVALEQQQTMVSTGLVKNKVERRRIKIENENQDDDEDEKKWKYTVVT